MNNLKTKLLILFVLLIALFSTVKTTYSRYSSSASGVTQLDIAKWKVKVNNTDITTGTTNSFTATPVMDYNYNSNNVVDGKIAPGTWYYVDIVLDHTDIEVSFTVNIRGVTSGVDDFLIWGYGWNPGDEIDYDHDDYYQACAWDNDLEMCNFTNDTYTTWDETINNKTDMETVRIWFGWPDSSDFTTSDEQLDDDDDSALGHAAANGTSTATPTATIYITYEQYFGE